MCRKSSVGWDFIEVHHDLVGYNVDLKRLRAKITGWGDANDDDEVDRDGEEELEGNIDV